jgi:methyltransferase-like protein
MNRDDWMPTLRQGLRTQSIGDESVLLDMANERVHQLNEVGTFILDRCDGRRTVNDIVQAVIEHYDVAEHVATRDATELLGRMKVLGIVQ